MFEPVRWDLTWFKGMPLHCTFGVHGVLDRLYLKVGEDESFDFTMRDDGIADLDVPPERLQGVEDSAALRLIGETEGVQTVVAVGALTVL